jgi:phosphate/phosphite/phosphonate ABC transporter binding protein
VVTGPAVFVLGMNPVVERTDDDYEESAGALVAYLQARLGRPVQLGIEPDYAAQIAKMRAGALDATFFGAYAFYRARREAGAVALVVRVEQDSNRPGSYQSVIVVRDDAALHTLQDLHGMRVGFVDPSSTAGYLIPRRMLREAGLDPDRDIIPCFCNTHQAVLEAVQAGEVAAGAMHRGLYTGLAQRAAGPAARLRTIATSAPVPAGPVAVRRDLDWETRQRLMLALLRVHDDPAAARLLLPPGSRFRPASSRSVTLKTVAALADTSYGTVSRVINRGAHVAPETYARVMDVIQQLDYRPNPTARSLVANRSALVGFVVPDATDPGVARYLEGVQRAVGQYGVHVVLCSTGGDRGKEASYFGLLETGAFGGLLLTEWSLNTLEVGRLAEAAHAIVLLGVEPGTAPVAAVAPDGAAALRLAHDYLRGLGHQHVAVLAPPSLARINAWHADQTCVATEPTWHDTEDDVVEAHAAASALLGSHARATALICGSERIALGVLQAARERGIEVPAALSVLALGNSWLADASAPPLTTVELSLEALGEHAGRLLLSQMDDDETLPAGIVLRPPTIVTRASTAGPGAATERATDTPYTLANTMELRPKDPSAGPAER